MTAKRAVDYLVDSGALHRLRFANGIPFAVEYTYVPFN